MRHVRSAAAQVHRIEHEQLEREALRLYLDINATVDTKEARLVLVG